ncbi:5-carboxymethyl-2-hydroxymuconate Delta-isomerase [Castellaniella sp.]|uniref:5-carboxymethyl-2-hydroxymuconate Delta-isomerase n=1 Tax=Castellaniella sp. TaxID=1955812 RepID=UPI003569C239
MPHLTLDYSANLTTDDDIQALCNALAQCLAHFTDDSGKPVFPVGGIRVRALRCEHYCIANGQLDAAYLHAHLKIGAGRSVATRTAAGDALFAVVQKHFSAMDDTRGLALSLEVSEFAPPGSWKHNNLHAWLKKGAHR